ncbi:MAG TPA: hypothetical protein VGY57_16215 [Vicinamibacterales bacterium]|jgi:hypothetical protein|nr:hypothetical protein [Vicinamibacterales bacterium]
MPRLLIVLAGVLVCAGCGPTIDLTQGLKVDIVNTGWYDMGIVNGQTKLVPLVTFTLKNVSDRRLGALEINALFRRVTTKDEWGSGFLAVNGSTGLQPGALSDQITIKSNLGYTGSDQSRQEMLSNSHFVDAKVELFGKYGSAQWTRLGEYPIDRKLIEK